VYVFELVGPVLSCCVFLLCVLFPNSRTYLTTPYQQQLLFSVERYERVIAFGELGEVLGRKFTLLIWIFYPGIHQKWGDFTETLCYDNLCPNRVSNREPYWKICYILLANESMRTMWKCYNFMPSVAWERGREMQTILQFVSGCLWNTHSPTLQCIDR
jgi:hypothetical protein